MTPELVNVELVHPKAILNCGKTDIMAIVMLTNMVKP